jgi:hypothetical protein
MTDFVTVQGSASRVLGGAISPAVAHQLDQARERAVVLSGRVIDESTRTDQIAGANQQAWKTILAKEEVGNADRFLPVIKGVDDPSPGREVPPWQ